MSKIQIDAYNYYKQLYPSAIMLFRVANDYVALCADAIKVAESLSLSPTNDSTPKTSFPSQSLEYVSKLASDGYEIHIIAVRNDENEFDYPDVHRIIEEISSDF